MIYQLSYQAAYMYSTFVTSPNHDSCKLEI